MTPLVAVPHMIITVMGTPCSGKSTAAIRLAKHYGLKHYSIGDLRRKAAAEKNMTLAEYNELGETEDTDSHFDDYQKRLGEIEDGFVIDGRLSSFFIPKGIHVFLDAEEDVRSQRMLTEDAEHERIGERPDNKEDAIALMRRRVESDKKRYMRHYNFDPYNPDSYKIVLDS
ncbi:AAA family ATPase, partial [Candidatus Woesearchaeota archaeon]|nr:AAA family ATPase [Candidatus Woesearchaeota archaeon]